MRQHKLKNIVFATALALAGAGMISSVEAAGLGRLTVTSALGQPLRAEIDLSSVTREEATSLAARLASPEAFRQAGIEYNPALLGVRFTVARRANGQFFISLESSQPINEPFIDMLVELNWATGRLVREYTFLLDPADMRPSVPQVAAAEPKPVADVPRSAPAPAVSAPPPPAAAPPVVSAGAPAPARKPAAPAEKPAPAAKPAAPAPRGGTGGSYEVKRGDTLGKIARQAKPDGVNLEQMLIAIQRSNPDAFVGGNINRLKSGVILNLPDKDAAAAVAAPDARRIVSAQAADWRAYQDKLASGVKTAPTARAEAPRQEARGRITARVEDKAQKGDAKDQLRLSKADPQGKAAPKAGVEDKVASERALKDAKAREAELEKNVKELQRLAELKNQQLAELQKQAQAKAAPSAPPVAQGAVGDAKKAAELAKTAPPPKAPDAAKAPEPPKPAEPAKAVAPPPKVPEAVKAPEPPKPAEPAKATVPPPKAPEAAKAPEAPKPAEPPKAMEAAKPAEPPKAAEAPKPAEPPQTAEPAKAADSKPAEVAKAPEAPKAPPKKPAVPPPPPPPEPSLMDEFLDNPLYLAGGGGILALLGGYAAYAVRRKRKVEKFENSIITGGDLKANSVFGNTGGQNVDTGNSSFQSDFSQVSSGAIDADEVDPVAEADVYMAYGRDAQAEEILKEALAKDPARHPVRLKLMEIYSQRSDSASFETHAKELRSATGGQGEHWARAAELGRALMPGNALFAAAGGGASDVTSTVTLGAGALAAAAAATQAPAASMESTMQMAAFPGAMAQPTEALTKTLSLAPVQATPSSVDVDFDLGGATPAASGGVPDLVIDAEPAASAPADLSAGLDFDLGGGTATAAPAAAASATDFSPGGTLIMGTPGSAAGEPDISMAETQPMPDVRPPEPPAPTIDFDFDLGSDTPAPTATAAAPAAAGNVMDFDLSGINLDLPAAGSQAAGAAPTDEAATKLDLAKAYQDMGDKEGAKELLQEVASEGNEAQKAEARKLLSAIG